MPLSATTYPLLPPDQIDYMDVAPDQLVSVAAALIPFLEHDDANRALMGSNMQRQAVPLLFPEAPLVGTGLEEKVARDSGAVILARRGGVVQRVTADEIIIDTGVVKPGKTMSRSPPRAVRSLPSQEVLAHQPGHGDQPAPAGARGSGGRGRATSSPTAPPRTMASWRSGATCSSLSCPGTATTSRTRSSISEKLVKEDVFTSIHIQELELQVRDTKRGMEEITREVPNVAEESLVQLDERGIVRIGARVKSGDILVGKITPKGETELSPEEKLLTAIFGEKAKDVKDSSLKVPPGMEGTVIDVKVFSRRIDDPLLEKERGERIGQFADLRA